MQPPADFATPFRAGLASGEAPDDVTAVDPAEVPRRFAVYRNNVVVSLVEALRQRFPVVERLVGEDFARAMFGTFVRAHPPQSPLMMEYGDAMPAFIAHFAPAAQVPYLADVARLEIARGAAYHAADAEPVAQHVLADAATAAPDLLDFALHPSVRVIVSAHPVHTIWSVNQPAAAPRPVERRAESVLVARAGLTVMTERLDAGAAAFIRAVQDGASFAEAAGRGAEDASEFDPTPTLGLLIGRGLVTGVAVREAPVPDTHAAS